MKKRIKTIPFEEATMGVFIGDTYCADEDDVLDKLGCYSPEDRPTEGVAARRVEYTPPNFYNYFMGHLYDRGPEGITDDPYPSIATACDLLTAVIKKLDIHWFEPIDFSDEVVYVDLTMVEVIA